MLPELPVTQRSRRQTRYDVRRLQPFLAPINAPDKANLLRVLSRRSLVHYARMEGHRRNLLCHIQPGRQLLRYPPKTVQLLLLGQANQQIPLGNVVNAHGSILQPANRRSALENRRAGEGRNTLAFDDQQVLELVQL
uniref:(northern house mosquito) hypothetical protein n=1 Tax=Culex pipiens TaxID=7175 RepID=A0A8D8BMX7_CULPI